MNLWSENRFSERIITVCFIIVFYYFTWTHDVSTKRMDEKTTLPKISWNDLLTSMHSEYISEFEQLFQISGNGSVTCSNSTVSKLNDFLAKWHFYFAQEEILIGNFHLKEMGWGDISLVNENKQLILQIYSYTFKLYLKSCRTISRQPHPKYGNVILVEVVVENKNQS